MALLFGIGEGHQERIEQVGRTMEPGGQGLLVFEDLLDLALLDLHRRTPQLGQLLAQGRPFGNAAAVERHVVLAVGIEPALECVGVGGAAVDVELAPLARAEVADGSLEAVRWPGTSRTSGRGPPCRRSRGRASTAHFRASSTTMGSSRWRASSSTPCHSDAKIARICFRFRTTTTERSAPTPPPISTPMNALPAG